MSKVTLSLWEAIGRKFMNMDYYEADLLSRSNKEFILNLFPSQNIYMPLLPMQARNAIGKVGQETLAVKNMLEKIGFRYTNEVDPFDGGPHYRCLLEDILPIKDTQRSTFVDQLNLVGTETKKVMIQCESDENQFSAITTDINIDLKNKHFSVPLPYAEYFKANRAYAYFDI